jgi:hypothetical protein
VNQLKADLASTLLAAGEDFPGFERGLMHKTVRVMMDTIKATLEHTLSRRKLLHGSPTIHAQINFLDFDEMQELTF